MANEITVNLQVNVANGNYSRRAAPGAINVDQAAQGQAGGVLSIGTSEETITLTDITTKGWAFFRNLDATNYVEWGPESGGSMIGIGRLEPGEPAALRLIPGSLTIRMQANTAACNVEVIVWED